MEHIDPAFGITLTIALWVIFAMQTRVITLRTARDKARHALEEARAELRTQGIYR